MDFLQIIYSSILSLAFLFVITKIMGYRQLTQLSFFDYVIGISIGSIASEMAIDLTLELWQPLLAMAVYGIFAVLISFATRKSIKARRLLTGAPIILIYKGKLIYENFKKAHFDVNDLLSSARSAGYFDLSDIEYAIVEDTGSISYLPYAKKQPCTVGDIGLPAAASELCANVIIDGKVMPNALKGIGKDETWLKKELDSIGLKQGEVFFATADNSGNFKAYEYSKDKPGFDLFM